MSADHEDTLRRMEADALRATAEPLTPETVEEIRDAILRAYGPDAERDADTLGVSVSDVRIDGNTVHCTVTMPEWMAAVVFGGTDDE